MNMISNEVFAKYEQVAKEHKAKLKRYTNPAGIHRTLEKEYEYCYSDKHIGEILTLNEYDFLSDGTFVTGNMKGA